jgi:hypothetical protein
MSYISMAVARSILQKRQPSPQSLLKCLVTTSFLFSTTAGLLVILLLGLEGRHGDTVQITLTGLSDATATLVLVNLEDVDLLERLADLAVNRAGGIDVTAGAGTAVLGGAVSLAKTADTDRLAEVDVTGDGGGADVEPVNVLGRELLGGSSLDRVNPTCR